MIVARELLRRYPTLRESWPAKQAREWREQQGYRRHPRRMSSWFHEGPRLRTRVCISNLEIPEAPHLCRATSVTVSLLDGQGEELASKRYGLARNGSLVLEVRDLLPGALREGSQSGQIRMDLEAAHLGSSRAYLHWYNERGITSSHEKFGLSIPAVGGYWTVPNVQHTPGYRTHLAVINLDARPYTSTVVLKDADGRPLEASMEIPSNGSRFVSLDDLFANPAGYLGSRPGILYFGNNRQPAIYYYFIENDHLGTWRAQHL